MYISRSETARKLKVTETRLRQLEKQGKLARLRASDVGYAVPNGAKGGRGAQWVYEEAQVAALVGKAGADTRFARQQRTEAIVFDQLHNGADIIDIVRKLRLDLPTVQRLRDVFVREKGGFVVTKEHVDAAKALGFDLTAKTLLSMLTRVEATLRGVKPANDKLSRLRIVAEDDDDDEDDR
jgi:hypothetical protein